MQLDMLSRNVQANTHLRNLPRESLKKICRYALETTLTYNQTAAGLINSLFRAVPKDGRKKITPREKNLTSPE